MSNLNENISGSNYTAPPLSSVIDSKTKTDEMIMKIRELDPDMIAPSTEKMYDAKQGGTKIVVIGKPGCFAKGTKILMFNGSIKKVEDIIVGDEIMGDDSSKRTVLNLCRGNEDMFRIVPKIGEPIVVNRGHIITIIKTTGRNRGQIIDMELADYLAMPVKYKSTYYNWIRVPVQFPSKNQHVDPYVIGFFLDGDFSFVKREFVKKQFRLCDSMIDNLIEKLVHYVPPNIMYSSISDRALFLAGLLDSRATYNTVTKRFDVALPTEELCDQIMFISGSLGYYSSKIKNYKSNLFTHSQQIIWNCYIYVNTNTNLPSKMFDINYIRTSFGGIFTTEFYIEPVGRDDYYGFEVDGNHRFLLSDMSVTHNSGKSYAITSLLYAKRHIFPVGVVFSGTEDSNGHWGQYFPYSFVYSRLDPDRVEKFLERQRLAVRHLPNPWAVMILDDCADETTILNSKLFKTIFKNGRHFKAWFILSVQYAYDLKPSIRSNIDYTFIFKETNITTRKKIFENYAGAVPDFATFNALMDNLTNDYTALVVCNTGQSNTPEDCLFWYKAPSNLPKDFKFGSVDFWNHHYARYDPNYKDPLVFK